MNSYAVLTGDVINSGELLEQVDYGDRLDEAFERFESSFAEQLVLEPDRYEGDRENKLLAGASDLLSAALIDLSRQQAEAVWYRLQEFSQQVIADRIGIRQQTVSDRLSAAYWRNTVRFVELFEETLYQHYRTHIL